MSTAARPSAADGPVAVVVVGIVTVSGQHADGYYQGSGDAGVTTRTG